MRRLLGGLLLGALLVGAAVVPVAASSQRAAVRSGLIAFQRGLGLSPTAQIWVIRADGTGKRPLIRRDTEGLVRPEWSADGKRIAFLSDDRPGQLAFVAAADGTKQKPLLPASVKEVHGITWSPSGRQVAFEATIGATAGLFIVTIGKRPKLLVRTPESSSVAAPAFSPNGKTIAYTVSSWDPSTNLYTSTLWSIDPNGSHRHKLQSLGATYGVSVEDIFTSTWSPDSKRIAAATATNSGTARSDGAQIVVMNADGTGLLTLTNTPGWNWYPAWSPNGKQIAFSSNRSGQFQLYVMNTDGSKQARLTHDSSFDTAPSWQPLR